MKVLIADDSFTDLREIEAMLRRSPPSDRGQSAKKYGDIGEPVALFHKLGSSKDCTTAPTGDLDEEGCGGSDPLPPCPPLDLQDQPEQLAALLDALGIALLNRGCLQEGKTLIEQAFNIRLKHFGDKHPATASSRTSRARVLRMEDDLIGAAKEINLALKINRKAFGKSGLPVAASLTELGTIQLYLGKNTDAEKSAREGLKILRKLRLDASDPNWTRLLDIQGRALLSEDKFSAADKVLDKAVRIDARQVGEHHPKYATHLANLATARWMLGDLSGAKKRFLSAIDVYETTLHLPGHPNLIDMYANLGAVLVDLGPLEEAREYLCKALGLNRQLRGPEHTLVGNDHANLGRLYFKKKDFARARDQFKKALAIYKANVARGTLPRKHPYIDEALVWLDRTRIACDAGPTSAS